MLTAASSATVRTPSAATRIGPGSDGRDRAGRPRAGAQPGRTATRVSRAAAGGGSGARGRARPPRPASRRAWGACGSSRRGPRPPRPSRRERALGEQVAGVRPDQAHAEEPAGRRLEHELGEPVGPPHGDGAPRRAPRHLHRSHLDAAGARLGLRQPAPRDLRIGEHDRRDRQGLEGGRAPGGRLRRDQALRDRLVREHRLAGDVPDGEHARVRRAPLGVHHDEAARVPRHARVLEPEIVRAGDGGPRPPAPGRPRGAAAPLRRRAPRSAPAPASRMPVSLVPSRICLNRFPSRRASGATRSRSTPGRSPSSSSTTVTSVPSAA